LAILAWAREAGAFLIEDDYDSEYRFEGRPALRLGYIVAPPALVDPLLALRFGTDHHAAGLDQAILCDFIVEGHLGRHIRRMRELYAARLAALQEGGLFGRPARYLAHSSGPVHRRIPAKRHDLARSRFTLRRTDLHGLVLGFGAFDEGQIRRGLIGLAAALERGIPKG
jgi:GntR family transcriptional regulator/MocR family aminotransferase